MVLVPHTPSQSQVLAARAPTSDVGPRPPLHCPERDALWPRGMHLREGRSTGIYQRSNHGSAYVAEG